MGDSEGAAPPSKKRFAAVQLSRDNPDVDDDGPEPEMGTFQRASDEVLATRKIVKVRRHQPSAASSNPFTALRFATPTEEKAASGTEPLPSTESQTPSISESEILTPLEKEVQKADEGSELMHEKTDQEKGTENVIKGNEERGSRDDGQNGQPDNNDQLADKTGSCEEVGDEKDKCEIVKDVSCSGEADKEVENGKHETGSEARASTEEVGMENRNNNTEEVAKGVGAESEKEKVDSDHKGKTESVAQAAKEVGEESEKEKVDSDHKGKTESVAPLKSFQQLSSSQNAFSGLAGTGFSSSSFTFGSTVKDPSSFGTRPGSLFGLSNDNPTYPSFKIGSVNHGAPLKLFGTTPSDATKSGDGGIAALQEVPVETGEENERVAFSADAVLFEYIDGGWKERGKGELKVNVSTLGDERARLVMRAKGNYRLILNASLYPDMSLTNMEKRGITFACVNSAGEGKGTLATFALKFKDSSIVEEFRGAVTAHKGTKKTTLLKTPENSPKASDD